MSLKQRTFYLIIEGDREPLEFTDWGVGVGMCDMARPDQDVGTLLSPLSS